MRKIRSKINGKYFEEIPKHDNTIKIRDDIFHIQKEKHKYESELIKLEVDLRILLNSKHELKNAVEQANKRIFNLMELYLNEKEHKNNG